MKRYNPELHGELAKAVIMTLASGKWSWMKPSVFNLLTIWILPVFHIPWNVHGGEGGGEVLR